MTSSREITTAELAEFAKASQHAAKLGGEILMKWLGKTSTKHKGPRDLVTEADFESQTVIHNFLTKEFPSHRFVGEEDLPESSATGEADDDFCWIVDPLDGTTNFVHSLRSFSVSVGLQHKKEFVAGTVLDPATNECFSAFKGGGATLNGQPISTSKCTDIGESLFIFSFGRGTDRNSDDTKRFLNMLETVGSIRRLGSAALNLCYVACGRTDGYWATQLSKWDIAAGFLIAQEAGAIIADFTGEELDIDKPHFCCAASTELFEKMKPVLNV